MQCLMQLKHYYLPMILSAKNMTLFYLNLVKNLCMKMISVKTFTHIILMPKNLEKNLVYDFTVNFDKQEAFDCLIHAEEFITEAKKFL